MKNKATGLPYVLSVNSNKDEIKKNYIKMGILAVGSLIELGLAANALINFDQVAGALWTLGGSLTLAGSLASGVIAENAENKLNEKE